MTNGRPRDFFYPRDTGLPIGVNKLSSHATSGRYVSEVLCWEKFRLQLLERKWEAFKKFEICDVVFFFAGNEIFNSLKDFLLRQEKHVVQYDGVESLSIFQWGLISVE